MGNQKYSRLTDIQKYRNTGYTEILSQIVLENSRFWIVSTSLLTSKFSSFLDNLSASIPQPTEPP